MKKSSVIQDYTYENGMLSILFPNGKWYKYGITENLFQEFEAAESLGQFFNNAIKDKLHGQEQT